MNRLGAKQAAAMIERGELTAEKLYRACLERIGGRDAEIRAWEHVEQRAPGEAKKPLCGVPVGVKDIFDTHDMPTGYGSPIYKGYRPPADAAIVALTRRAGGSVLGKTVTTEFATMVPSRTRNPCNPAHTPGGSSSGSAAAVADFHVPLAFGTQTAGSLIRPAAYCGIVAYKPTFNLLPRGGMKAEADSLDTVGVMARSVEDAAFFVSALSGMAFGAKVDRPRVGVFRGSVEAPMAAALEHAAAKLEAREIRLPRPYEEMRAAHAAILWYEFANNLADEYRRFPEKVDPALRDRCEKGLAMDRAEYLAARRSAAQCRARLDEAFGDCDVLIAPAATGEAPQGLGSTGDTAMNTVWTMLHVPCVALPAGRGPRGLPLGLQAIGRIGDDARTLACAQWMEGRLA
ncbi:MAG: amidase [Betaproteobacteria bacterium]